MAAVPHAENNLRAESKSSAPAAALHTLTVVILWQVWMPRAPTYVMQNEWDHISHVAGPRFYSVFEHVNRVCFQFFSSFPFPCFALSLLEALHCNFQT